MDGFDAADLGTAYSVKRTRRGLLPQRLRRGGGASAESRPVYMGLTVIDVVGELR